MSDKSARSKRLYVKKLDWKRMPGRKGKRGSNKMRKQKGWDSKKNSPKKNSELSNEMQKEPPRRLTNSWRLLRISLSQSSPRIQKCRQLQLIRHQLLWKLWKPRHRLNQDKRRNKRHAKSKKSTSPRRNRLRRKPVRPTLHQRWLKLLFKKWQLRLRRSQLNHLPRSLSLKKRLASQRRLKKQNTGEKRKNLSSQPRLWLRLQPLNSSKFPLVSSSKYPLDSQWCRWWLRLIKLSCQKWKQWLLSNFTSSTYKPNWTTSNRRRSFCSSSLYRRACKFHKWCIHLFRPTFRTHNNSLTPVTSEHCPADKQV